MPLRAAGSRNQGAEQHDLRRLISLTLERPAHNILRSRLDNLAAHYGAGFRWDVRAPTRRYGAKDLVSAYFRASTELGVMCDPTGGARTLERWRGPLRESAAPEGLVLGAVLTLRHYRRG
jgi:hypothetical protein